jgi:hypothetical protein
LIGLNPNTYQYYQYIPSKSQIPILPKKIGRLGGWKNGGMEDWNTGKLGDAIT